MNLDLPDDGVYTELAEFFFFQTNLTSEKVVNKLVSLGLIFRKNKSLDDVSNARKKAIKHGGLRTELEISMLSVYLKDIFKKERKC